MTRPAYRASTIAISSASGRISPARSAARARAPQQAVTTVAMATAHPAKFPEAMERATGLHPTLPDRLADLFEREEHFTVLPNDLTAVESAVRALAARNTP